MTGILLAAWLAASPVQAEEAVLEAVEVSIEDGIAVGTGPVRIAIGGDEIEGTGFSLDLEGATLVVEKGAWSREDGVLAFERAEVALEDLTGVVLRGRFRGAATDLIIRGETIEILDETHLSGHRVGLTTCDCASGQPIWEVTARRVRVTLDDSVSFWGGWIRVGNVPFLPVPYGRASLVEGRPRLEFPQLRLTGDGLEVGQPVFVPLGEVEWTATPKWHQTRGVRLENALTLGTTPWGTGSLESVAGFDALTDAWRAGVEAELAHHGARWRHGVDATWLSDDDLLSDYDADYLDRNLDFFERRAFVQTGRVRLAHRSVQSESVTTQRPVSLGWWNPATSARSVDLWNAAGVAWVGEGADATALDDARWVGFGHAGFTGAHPLGPLLAEAEVGVIAALDDLTGLLGATEAQLEPVASARVSVPLWGDHSALRHLADPGLSVDLRPDSTGTVFTAWAGPRLTSQWLTSKGAPFAMELSVPTDGEDWAPLGRAWAQSGSFWASVAGEALVSDTVEQSVSVGGGFDDGLRGVTLHAVGTDGFVDTADFGQVAGSTWWTFDASGDRWTPSVHLRADLLEQSLLEQGLGLRFRTRCNCLDVSARANWSEDRTWPEVSVAIDIRE